MQRRFTIGPYGKVRRDRYLNEEIILNDYISANNTNEEKDTTDMINKRYFN